MTSTSPSLGYSSSTLGLLGDFEQLPRYSIESTNATTAGRVATLGAQQSGFNNGRTQPFYNVQFAATVTKMTGGHTMKIGYDWRSLRQKETNLGSRGGAYAFDSSYTPRVGCGHRSVRPGHRRRSCSASPIPRPSSSFVPSTTTPVVSHGFFAHDDWRVTDRLTLNLGLRYDLELGMTEATIATSGRSISTTPSPIQAAAQARFAASPPAGVPGSASQFDVLGGYTYLDRRSVARVERGPEQLPAASGRHVQDRRPDGPPRRHRQVRRAFPTAGRAGTHLGVSIRSDTRATRRFPSASDHGLTFQANLSNPVPSDQLRAAGGIGTGSLDQSRKRAGQHLERRSREP